MDFYFNSRCNILFAKLRPAGGRACFARVHTKAQPPSSTTNPIRRSAEPFAGAKRFLYVCNDANNLYAPTPRRYSFASFSLLPRRCYPLQIRSFHRCIALRSGIYFPRTNAMIGRAHLMIQWRVKPNCGCPFISLFRTIKNKGRAGDQYILLLWS